MNLHACRTILCALLLTAGLAGQEFRASISGTVTDPSGAPVEGAKVVVTSVERNISAEAATNTAGRYLVQFLLPGGYRITAEKTGFKKFLREGITLAAADRLGLDIRLELGTLAESVTVTGEAPLLQTEVSSRTATIENRFVDNIPTSGRNLFQFQYTLPGVLKGSNYWGDFELYAFGNINNVIISGGRRGENETLVDGISDTRMDRGVAFMPALQAVQEFTVLSNSYDAQYGRVGGGVNTIVLKSGTNSLHGQLFHFIENEKFYANPWGANALGISRRVPFKQNVPGFGLDGPFYVPKLLDTRNRAFFMIALEALRERNPGVRERTLPTAEQMQGDFSGLRNTRGQSITIYDPASTRLGPSGAYIRDPFPTNRIPSARINPVAAKVASFYPKPNRPPIGLDNALNYALITPSKNSYDHWVGKMDLRITQKSSFMFRYGQTPWSNFSQIVWGTNAAEPSGEAPSTRISRNWGADWTYTLSPSMVFNLRGGLARYEGFSGNIYAKDYDPRQLGFPDSLVRQFTALQFPRFNMGRYSELGATRVTSYETHDTYSLQPNLSWTRGRHSAKYGAEFRRYNRNQLQPGAASGIYGFDKRWTQAEPLRADALSGDEFASFLLGHPSSGSVDRNMDPAYRNHYVALFVQDDWKASPRVTVNVGLRWDYESPVVERFNRMVRGFAFDQTSPLASKVSGLNLRGGLIYAGSSGAGRQAFLPDRNNIQPRIGVAWQFAPKWVVRGGYGLTFLGQSSWGPATGFSQPTSLIGSTDGNLTPAVTLSDPYPSRLFPTGLLQPIGSSLGLATNLGLGVSAQLLDRPLPYSHQFSLGFQRELPWNFLLDASYVGNITRKVPLGLGLNFLPTNELTRLPVADRPAYFTGQAPNPMAGLLPGSAFNGANIPRQQLLMAYPHFSGVSISDVPIGSQRYDSLQMKATRRFSAGLSMQISYTLSKNLEEVSPLNAQDTVLGNLLDTGLEKRLNEFDSPHTLAAVTSYEVPVGRGKRFGGNLHPVLNGVVGGWNLNIQYMLRSGLPFAFPNAAPLAARSAKFSHAQRDELAQKKGRSQFDPVFDVFFDTSLFPNRTPAPYTLRDFPTRFPDVRSKALNIWEIGIAKEFPIKERLRFQLRADAQNAFNYPWFSRLQTADVTNARFGMLNPGPNSEAREIVLVAKLVF
ncbi:MAG: TonB-dependent receptor [Acidobacteriota bacterium]